MGRAKQEPRRKRLLLFVCTGNICRSPMAEYLMRDRLEAADGWEVASAGVMGSAGQPASGHAVTVLRSRGIDLRPHRSRPLDKELVDAASLVVVMTHAHQAQCRMLFPEAKDRLHLLKAFSPEAPAGGDIEDPIGMPVGIYRQTCRSIDAALPGLVDFIKNLD